MSRTDSTSAPARSEARSMSWLAVASLLCSLVFCHACDRQPSASRAVVREGPRSAVRAGFAGDVLGFKAPFHGRGAAASDDEVQAFIDELRTRYGEFVDSRPTGDARQSTKGRYPIQGIPYVLEFDRATVTAETGIIFHRRPRGADGIFDVPRLPQPFNKLAYVIVFDPDLGGLTFPSKMHTGVRGALGAGFAGDVRGFDVAFRLGPVVRDANVQTFLSELRSRYGDFIEIRLDEGGGRPADSPETDSIVFRSDSVALPYVIEFENATVSAEAVVFFGEVGGAPAGDPYLPVLSLTVFDSELGDLAFPRRPKPGEAPPWAALAKMIEAGPRDALRAGFAGDMSAFKAQFGLNAVSDADAEAFIEGLRTRYGAFVDCRKDLHVSQRRDERSRNRRSGGDRYILEFENATVPAKVGVSLSSGSATDRPRGHPRPRRRPRTRTGRSCCGWERRSAVDRVGPRPTRPNRARPRRPRPMLCPPSPGRPRRRCR